MVGDNRAVAFEITTGFDRSGSVSEETPRFYFSNSCRPNQPLIQEEPYVLEGEVNGDNAFHSASVPTDFWFSIMICQRPFDFSSSPSK